VIPATRLLVPALGAIAFAAFGAAACTSASTQPPQLGDCVKTGDASCADPNTGGGGGGPSSGGEGGTASSSGSGSSSGATCGDVSGLVGTQNLDCAPCIDGTLEGGSLNCCQAATACGNDCQTLLTCITPCASGDTTCVGTCENNTPAGVGAYNDFAACLSQNCTPECPTLQH
jgi:hypothetical protein